MADRGERHSCFCLNIPKSFGINFSYFSSSLKHVTVAAMAEPTQHIDDFDNPPADHDHSDFEDVRGGLPPNQTLISHPPVATFDNYAALEASVFAHGRKHG
jgi:hypothetical protein